MQVVRLSPDFGIVVRKEAIKRKRISFEKLLQIMETSNPFDENEVLISLGPHFGQEATNELIQRLEYLGLTYGEDFFDFSDMVPDWCRVYVGLNNSV